MLNAKKIGKIINYLNLFACGTLNNGLTEKQVKEVLDLSCECLDLKDELEKL